MGCSVSMRRSCSSDTATSLPGETSLTTPSLSPSSALHDQPQQPTVDDEMTQQHRHHVHQLHQQPFLSAPSRNVHMVSVSISKADHVFEATRRSFLSGSLLVDSQCPLDARQLYGLTKSWKAINRNMAVTAINMFVRMFETNTDIKEMFSNMKHLKTVAELRNSKLVETHAMKVICTLDDAIINMDDMDYVIRTLQESAQSHCLRLARFDGSYFWRIEEPFIEAVREELGDRFTTSLETTYRTTIHFILKTMTKEIDRCQLSDQAKTSQQVQKLSSGMASSCGNNRHKATLCHQTTAENNEFVANNKSSSNTGVTKCNFTSNGCEKSCVRRKSSALDISTPNGKIAY